MILPKGSIIKVASFSTPATKNALTEHNRSELSVNFERIGKTERMANARKRGWFVADKRSWDVSWEMVPHTSAYTVDGFWGGEDISDFYKNTPTEFWLYVRLPDGTEEQVLVSFNSFSAKVQKRGKYEFWSISATIEEV